MTAAAPCNCIAEMDEHLAPHNCQLVTNLLGPQRAVVATMKVVSKKRGAVPYVMATYCPFCGVAYPKDA